MDTRLMRLPSRRPTALNMLLFALAYLLIVVVAVALLNALA
jgi:hypothetical protein